MKYYIPLIAILFLTSCVDSTGDHSTEEDNEQTLKDSSDAIVEVDSVTIPNIGNLTFISAKDTLLAHGFDVQTVSVIGDNFRGYELYIGDMIVTDRMYSGQKVAAGSRIEMMHHENNYDISFEVWKERLKRWVANQDQRIEFEIVFTEPFINYYLYKNYLYMEAMGGEISECFHLTQSFHIGDTSIVFQNYEGDRFSIELIKKSGSDGMSNRVYDYEARMDELYGGGHPGFAINAPRIEYDD